MTGPAIFGRAPRAHRDHRSGRVAAAGRRGSRGVAEPPGARRQRVAVRAAHRAAHGAEVEPSAADWVLDFGSSIILQLDNILKNRTLHNQSIQRTPRSRR